MPYRYTILPLAALALLAAACSREQGQDAGQPPSPTVAAPASPPAALNAGPQANTLTPQSLGSFAIDGPAPASWPAQETCRDLTPDGYPHAYAIVRDGKIRRITALPGAKITLEEGIGPGTAEAKLKSAIPGLLTEPHKYLPAPAKVLTVPFSGDGPTLRFEIDGRGRISAMSAGVTPEIAYVEGCG